MRKAAPILPQTRLSKLFRDPFLKAAFERAEHDQLGDGLLVLEDHPPSLDSGAAEALTGTGARRVPAIVEG